MNDLPLPSSPARRLPVLLAVVALVAGLVADHFIEGSGASTPPPPGPQLPALAPAGALASTWYCPALGATPDSSVRGRIIIGDPGPADLHITTTFVPSTGPSVVKTATVPAYTRLTYKLEEQAPGPYTAAKVDIDGSGGAVEQLIQGPLGQSVAPCSTAASDHWYFASGRTDTGATMLLSLYNPFASVAIADLRFATDQGPTSPDAYQGLVIPAGTETVISVGDRVRLRTAIATTVSTRSGRLIVDKLEIQQGQGSRAAQGSTPFSGLSLTLGATAPGRIWYFPDGVKAAGITEHFDLYNPSDTEADVQVAPTLEQGSADPFGITVPPFDRVSLQVDQEDRIPASVGQAWIVTTTAGPPVVAERVYEELSPAARRGVADTIGSPRLSTRWVFPAGSSADGADEYVILFNPGTRAAKVNLTVSGTGQPTALKGASPLTLAAGTRQAVRIGDVYRAGIVMLDVASDQPIVAERSQANVSLPGLSGSLGVAGP